MLPSLACAIMVAIVHQQGPVADPSLNVSIENNAVVVGATYRPIGDEAELQRDVARVLSEGAAPRLLSIAAGRDTRVRLDASGTISIEVEALRAQDLVTASFGDEYGDLLVASLGMENDELSQTVEEIGGPDAALVVRAALVLSGNGELIPVANAIIVLGKDPEVQAAAAVLAQNGMTLGKNLAAASGSGAKDYAAHVAAATNDLKAKLGAQSAATSVQVQEAAQLAWSAAAQKSTSTATAVRASAGAVLNEASAAVRQKAIEGSDRASQLGFAAAQERDRIAQQAQGVGRIAQSGILDAQARASQTASAVESRSVAAAQAAQRQADNARDAMQRQADAARAAAQQAGQEAVRQAQAASDAAAAAARNAGASVGTAIGNLLGGRRRP